MLVYINGQRCEVREDEAFLSLSDFLREANSLTGTKIVCSEGDCGACTVLVGEPKKRRQYYPMDACILFMHQLDCRHVVTIEVLKRNGALHPIQEAFVQRFASQCGFCTPGFVMAVAGVLEGQRKEHGHVDDECALHSHCMTQGLTGNLCRCTGYVQIIESTEEVDMNSCPRMDNLFPDQEMKSEFDMLGHQSVHIQCSHASRTLTLFLPATWQEAVELRAKNVHATVISGATDVVSCKTKADYNPV